MPREYLAWCSIVRERHLTRCRLGPRCGYRSITELEDGSQLAIAIGTRLDKGARVAARRERDIECLVPCSRDVGSFLGCFHAYACLVQKITRARHDRFPANVLH